MEWMRASSTTLRYGEIDISWALCNFDWGKNYESGCLDLNHVIFGCQRQEWLQTQAIWLDHQQQCLWAKPLETYLFECEKCWWKNINWGWGHKFAQSIACHHLRSKDPIRSTSIFPQLASLSTSVKSNQSQCAQHQHHQCASFLFLPSLLALLFLSSYLNHLYPQDPCPHLVHPSHSLPLCNLNHHFLCQPTPLLFHLTNFGCMRWSLGAQDVPGVCKSRIDECCISIKWSPPSSFIPYSSSFL